MHAFNKMSVKKWSLGAAMALVLGMVVSFVAPSAMAAGDPYRMVLRYYDDVQITYSLTYPAAGTPSPVVKAEDVPIGGVGTPDASNVYALNDVVFPQVYCVDPWTAFHSQVTTPGIGGSSKWFPAANGDTGYTADSVSGYVDAAPWAGTGALQTYADAVNWLATNGYRGDYVHNPTLTDDAESQASVDRLNAMFHTLAGYNGAITKEIALMATKVAIWKVVGGDGVQVVKTTLDNRTDGSRAIFDALVDALVNAALNPSSRPTSPVMPSSLSLAITDAGATYTVGTLNTDYSYYGPMKVVATLNDAPGDLSGMTQASLSVSGLNSTGVAFVPAFDADPATTSLNTGKLPGTAKILPYISGTGSGDTWTSDEFYLAVPKERTPDNGDQLVVKAQAKAPAVEVAEGTPVVLAFQQSNGVQDWDAIQAFIGATTGDQTVDLYAEANWSTGDSNIGALQIKKTVDNVTINDQEQLFTFAVYYSTDDADTNPAPLDLKEYPVTGAISVNTTSTPNTFTLRNGSLGTIEGLTTSLVNSSAGYDTYYYWVKEVTGSLPSGEYGPPQFVFDNGATPVPNVDGTTIGPFQIDDNTGISLVSVTDTRLAGDLTIKKNLAGAFNNFGVDDTTEYSVVIRESVTIAGKTAVNYLLFEDTATPFTYKCVGNNGVNDQSSADVLTITAGQPITVTNLWSNVKYTVIETSGSGYKITYTGNNVLVTAGGQSNIAITNTYGGPDIETGGSLVGDGWVGLVGVALISGLSLGAWQLFGRRAWAH